MCGIVGVLRGYAVNIPAGTIGKMMADSSHRGPDDEGMVLLSAGSAGGWQACREEDAQWTVALGSRRLSILDLSHAGHMPMVYRERFWITYNGEVYNFIEIRTELEKLGHMFRSVSDTEVILAAYAEWGTHCFARLRGMWGIVIFDTVCNEIILCRDRMGIKPLYLWQGAGIVAIASEIKQLLHIPGFAPRMNLSAAAEYLRTGYEDAGRSFFRDVWPVPAGSWIKIPVATLVPTTPEEYWHPERIQAEITNVEEASQLFADKLRESVRLHLRSDVPVGCALSGGLDSSAIAMIVNQYKESQDHPLHTFTSTFPGDKVDEREYVDEVVSAIRSTPHFATPDAATFLTELNSFLWTHDEPVGSLSVYASYCIARLTREAGIAVTLNGQGGDEILSGYWQSYFMHLRMLARQGHALSAVQHLGGALTKHGNPGLLAQVPVMLKRYRTRSKPASLIRLYGPMAGAETPILRKVLALDEQAWRLEEIRNMFLPRLLKWDDRNSMAFSVEGRYPFLDHRLIELCLSFAPSLLYRSGWTKLPLRLGLRGTLPGKILNRRSKIGFEVPQDEWLSGPLRAPLEKWLKQDRPIWAYVERVDVQKLASQVWRGKRASGMPGAALLRLFIFDRWVEVFGVV
jgi:asparagine synthase (glutamine-hydrolysing)